MKPEQWGIMMNMLNNIVSNDLNDYCDNSKFEIKY